MPGPHGERSGTSAAPALRGAVPGPAPSSAPGEAPAHPDPSPGAPADTGVWQEQTGSVDGLTAASLRPGRSGPSAALLLPSTRVSPFPGWISPFPPLAGCERWGSGVSLC